MFGGRSILTVGFGVQYLPAYPAGGSSNSAYEAESQPQRGRSSERDRNARSADLVGSMEDAEAACMCSSGVQFTSQA
jgi:hypothetical protein